MPEPTCKYLWRYFRGIKARIVRIQEDEKKKGREVSVNGLITKAMLRFLHEEETRRGIRNGSTD